MSGSQFHVHGPHDHELEHAAQGHNKADTFSGRIAVTTALLATVGALFACQAGATQANAALYKNNAAISKTEAANQWNYDQAKSSKQNLAELGASLTGGDKATQFNSEAARYRSEKAEIQATAQKLEAESKEWDTRSDEAMHLHHRWAQATTALQIAIAMAAIALLTRRSWLQYAMYGVAALGGVVGVLALLHI
jgi:ABC-type multidrug transport system fused ATPase/permease subunit